MPVTDLRARLVAVDAAYYRARGAAERGQVKVCRKEIEGLIDALSALIVERQRQDRAQAERLRACG